MSYKRTKGFTLIETLLAVLIFVIICSSLYFSLHVGLGALKRERANFQIYQQLRVSLKELQEDMRSLFCGQVDELEPLSGDKNSLFIICYKPGGLYEVNYYQQENDFIKSTRKIFFIESEGNEKTIKCSEPRTYNLASSAKEVNFEYLNFNGVWESEWSDVGCHPRAVKVTLYFINEKEANSKFQTIISIPIGRKIPANNKDEE